MNLKIITAAHKPYRMPSDPVYIPVWVGAAKKVGNPPEGWLRDDVGENISEKNSSYCELTALYWAWKNCTAEYVGLCHYRRYFAGRQIGEKWDRIADGAYLSAKLEKVPALLPRKRNYYIESNYSQYVHAHHAEDLDITRSILSERCPEYLPAFDASMRRTSGHRFNMLVMRKDLLDGYCTWLFAVLGELERRLDISAYSAYDKRVFGFVSERLLDVWMETNAVPYKELPVINLENQHWGKKIAAFLKRKFCKKTA